MRETNKKMILNNNENNIVLNKNEEKMDTNMSLNLTLTKTQLLEKCKELGITKCSSKTKPQLVELINNKNTSIILKSDSEENVVISETIISAPLISANEEQGQLRFIDLFCGIGGFHQALSKLGAKCVLACDIDKDCRTVYKDNYGIEPVTNIKEIDEKIMPDFDVLCGGFPCFVAGTQTLTNNGYKNIEDVQLTDKLLTHTGQFHNILNLQRKTYNGQMFDLKIKYHPEIITATEEHPFYVREKKKVWNCSLNKYNYTYGEPEWKIASKLTKNDYYGMVINNKHIIPEFTFDKIINKHKTEQINIKLDNLDYWFVMGYLVGDGWVEETTKKDGRCMYKIRFAINNKDENEVFERINRVIPITDKKCDNGKCKKFGCSNLVWFNILKKFGKYAHGKLIPEWVQDAPKEFIQEFINGYMKADGCISNNVLQITTVSHNLAYGLQRLYLKLGHIFSINKCIRPKTYIIEGRTVNQKDTYCVKGVLQREKNVSSFIEGNYVWYAPFKITKRETSQIPVYNFEVETDNSYVVKNVCVHNCQAFSNGGKKLCFEDDRGLLFDEIVRIARVKKPKFMFLENVKHILKVSNGKVIDYIKQKIASIGYTLQLFQISPHNYGIPQQRERVYFVCVRNDIYNGNEIVLPTYSGKLEFTKFLDKKEEIDPKYFIKDDTLKVLEVWDEMIKHFEVGEKISPTIMINDAFKQYSQSEFDAFPDWKRDYITKNKPLIQKYYSQFIDWYNKNTAILQKKEIYGKLEWQTGLIKNQDSIFNHFVQIRQSGIRVKKGNYFPTLVAISQIPIYGKEKRYITPRECARLQSFPETFKLPKEDKKSYKQLGNSVNVDNVFTVISSTLKNYSLV
jgi:DNA (cytosine-5)-methyltransferase 1